MSSPVDTAKIMFDVESSTVKVTGDNVQTDVSDVCKDGKSRTFTSVYDRQ